MVEEKKRHRSVESLRAISPQIKEYQYLHGAVWGLVTTERSGFSGRTTKYFIPSEVCESLSNPSTTWLSALDGVN